MLKALLSLLSPSGMDDESTGFSGVEVMAIPLSPPSGGTETPSSGSSEMVGAEAEAGKEVLEEREDECCLKDGRCWMGGRVAWLHNKNLEEVGGGEEGEREKGGGT